MNFTAGGCRQQGQTNHSVDRINHIQTMQDDAVGRHQVFLRTWKRRLRL